MTFRSPFPDVAIPNLALTDFVLANAAAHSDRPALVDAASGRAISYHALIDRIRRLAAGLAARGLRHGDVVAIWAPNVPEYGVVFHAVARLGAIVTTANPASTDDDVRSQLVDSRPVLLVTTHALLERARSIVTGTAAPIEIVALDTRTPDATGLSVLTIDDIAIDADPPAVAIDPANDVVAMPYSSGTTGLPKGVMLTHRNLVANLVQIDTVETEKLEALLGVLPFFHIYAMVVGLNLGLLRGSTIVTLQRFDFETVLRVLQDWPITLAHVVPPVVVALAKHPAVDGYDLSRLRCIFSGAAPLGAGLTAEVERRLKVRVRQGYGMTEASPATHYTVEGFERAGKAGRLLPSTECRIVDPETGTDRGVDERGEVWIRGPQVMKGYLNNREATTQTVDADGWLHTGDIGVVDADGFLEVVDRLKELIKVNAYQVAPAELEALLLTHPQIADAAVIPVPDDDCGEVPKAVVVARSPIEAAEVMRFVESRVSHYKRVRQVSFVDQIPRSPSGKILRRVLMAREPQVEVS